MSKKDEFDECITFILSDLYESFPVPKDLEISSFKKWGNELFFSIIKFMKKEEIIQYDEFVYDGCLSVTLTLKGLEIVENKMLDKNLYETLVILKKHEIGGKCIVTVEKEGLQDRKLFDRLVQRAIHLRKLGYLSFSDEQIRRDMNRADADYCGLICRIEYEGTKALLFSDFSAYRSAYLHNKHTSYLNIDQSLNINGNISSSNIASHSSKVTQNHLKMEVAEILDQMFKTVQSDKNISESERENKIEDIESLRKELSRLAPRPSILRTLYTDIASTASIASLASQLWPHLLSIIGA